MLDHGEDLPAGVRLAAGLGERAHRLAAGELVQHEAVDLQQVHALAERGDHVVLPGLVEEGAGEGAHR